MTLWSSSSSPSRLSLLLSLLSLLLSLHHPKSTTTSTRVLPSPPPPPPVFREAPAFRNPNTCNSMKVNIVMTLDSNYLRGTMAAVLSILQHSTCPENNNFHFLSLHIAPQMASTIESTFPYLNFKIYRFDPNLVHGKISKSLRLDLDQPLNYARIYLSMILPIEIDRVIYLDSDIIVVDDIAKLWTVDLGDRVIAAPEYCHANFTYYFTDAFWADPDLSSTFRGREACYFNTGVMVVDLEKWRGGEYINKVEKWMLVQKVQKRIYHLGSLPPFLLVFGGYIRAIDHRWNQHGLGGDNFEGKCRGLHPGPISLLHWSGKGKPWLRLDSRRPCIIDHLWAPYDLYRSSAVRLEE